MPFLYSDSSLTAQQDAVMPIAVVGVGGRFPGDASDPEKLWKLIANRQSALAEIPKDRFNVDAFYHPDGERLGSINLRNAHCMNQDLPSSTRPFSPLHQTKQNQWIRSSGWLSKWHTKLWKMASQDTQVVTIHSDNCFSWNTTGGRRRIQHILLRRNIHSWLLRHGLS